MGSGGIIMIIGILSIRNLDRSTVDLLIVARYHCVRYCSTPPTGQIRLYSLRSLRHRYYFGAIHWGALSEKSTWRWVRQSSRAYEETGVTKTKILYTNVPTGRVAVLILYLSLNVHYDKEMTLLQKLKRIDFVGNGLLISSTTSVLFALIYGISKRPWSSWNIIVPLILGFCGFALFAAWEIGGFPPEPVVSPRLF